MANVNEYIDETYNTLLKLSADDIKRLEYEAIRDYNSQRFPCAAPFILLTFL